MTAKPLRVSQVMAPVASWPAVFCLLVAAAPTIERPALAEDRVPAGPNVVLVMTDDQGYGDLACHGNRWIETPHLDALYRESVRLTDFHVSPLCTPTRAALLTGQNPLRVGAWGTTWGRSMPRAEAKTIADVFAQNGYRTGCFGKWHLGDNYPFRPQDRGFSEVLIHGGGGVGQTPDYWGNTYFDDTYFRGGRPEKFTGYCTDVWFDGALRFIETNRNRPFFVYLATNAPHSPYHVAEKYSRLYAGDDNVPNAAFYGMITNIDENVGRLVAKLDELKLARDTILIFTTDNGTSAGFRTKRGFNAGMRGTKGSLYDGGHRVPCFIRWPGGNLVGGRDVDALSAHIDMPPTLIELCGLRIGEETSGARFHRARHDGIVPHGFDGISLAPLLLKKTESLPDREIFVQFRQSSEPPQHGQAAVLTPRWRLIGLKQLFDIKTDPGQQNDVAGQHPQVVDRLARAYETWWADVSERFDDYSEIVLGTDHENPVRLTCFDWHTKTPWNQGHILGGMAANGFWAVEVAQSGRYEIVLRRWPEEVDVPITRAPADGGQSIPATTARLKIGPVDLTQPIPENATTVTFQVDLKAGKAKLRTWLSDVGTGSSRGAYYVSVRRK